MLALLAALAGAAPGSFTHQGRLLDAAGDPISGTHDLTVHVWDGTTEVWTAPFSGVPVEQGVYTLHFGDATLLGALSSDDLYISVDVDGVALGDRMPINAVPLAQRAVQADAVDGPVDATVVRVNGVEVIGTDGKIAYGAIRDPAHTHAAADITSGRLHPDRAPVARVHVGTLDIPVAYSGIPSGWTTANPATAVGFSISDYNDYVGPGQELQGRVCLSYTDSGDSSGKVQLRLKDDNSNTVWWSYDFSNTWSSSGLIHSDCSSWGPASSFDRCNYGWGDTCVLQVHHTQSRNTTLYAAWLELSVY